MVTDPLQKSFNFWLESVFEDDEIPLEVNNIIIYIKYNKEHIYLSFGGCETFPDINNLQYYPLEAQFFYDKNLTSELFIHHINDALTTLIKESMESSTIRTNLKSKKIYSYLNGNYTKLKID